MVMLGSSSLTCKASVGGSVLITVCFPEIFTHLRAGMAHFHSTFALHADEYQLQPGLLVIS